RTDHCRPVPIHSQSLLCCIHALVPSAYCSQPVKVVLIAAVVDGGSLCARCAAGGAKILEQPISRRISPVCRPHWTLYSLHPLNGIPAWPLKFGASSSLRN